ncbi:MAG: transcription antitermination protein NusB [Prevotellaceae bacterium]|jgi:N utilization substance protein B|nr:transcription antitermination protein NusB [Prevotellaceae bacterium]
MISRRLLRIKVLKVLFAHIKSGNQSQLATEKELAFSINKTYDLYHYVLLLLVKIGDYAQNRINIGKQKYLPTEEEKCPNTKFVDNAVIKLLRQNKILQNYVEQEKLSWDDSAELLKKIFNNMVNADYYKKYMLNEKHSFTEDKQLICKILECEIEDLDYMYTLLEEKNIYWIDDLGFVLSMAIKTIKAFRANQDSYTELLPLYQDENNEKFALRLLRRTLADYDKTETVIDEYTKNWDLERLAFMDTLILQILLAEVREFPEIPVSISIDEYLEIAKYFSSPTSSAFVNGVADKIINKEIKEKNIIKYDENLQNKN